MRSSTSSTSPQVFLSYAHEDLETVRRIHEDLILRDVNVWFDKIKLGPGKWKPQILRAIRQSRYFLICLSQAALNKMGDQPGFQDSELNDAYNIAVDQDEALFTIIPLRLENCDRGDNRLSQYQQFDLFSDWDKIIDRLAVHMGGRSLKYAMSDDRTEKEKQVEAFEGRALAFHYAGENERAGTAANPLIQILQDENEDSKTRYTAIAAIGRIRPEAEIVIESLIRAIKDKDQQIHRIAGQTLLGLEIRGKVNLVEPLLRMLEDKENAQVRFYGAAAIGRIGPEAGAAVEPLIRALRDKDWKVRRITTEALSTIGPSSKSALGPLIEVLKDQSNNEWVRSNAALALVKIGPEEEGVIEALTEALNDNSEKVRNAAGQALKQ